MEFKVIETFSGIGAQAKALERIKKDNPKFEYKIEATVEWEIGAIFTYDIIRNGKQDLSKYDNYTKEDLVERLSIFNISSNGKDPLPQSSLSRMNIEKLKAILHSIEKNNNFVDITAVKAKELPYADLLTYSFPCQDLSISSYWHNNLSGINRDSNNRSSLLWEIERILQEYHLSGKKKPKFLLMENVTAIQSTLHKDNFLMWQNELEEMGYANFPINLNAKNFGVPQNRNRTYMLSVLTNDDAEKNVIEDMLNELKALQGLPSMKGYIKLDYDNPIYFAEAELSTPKNTPSRKDIQRVSRELAKGQNLTGRIANTITTKQDRRPNAGIITHQLDLDKSKATYRNLTPRETFLLMGFDESDFDRLIENNFKITSNRYMLSRSKLLQLAGNSIVVDVLEEIFKVILKVKSISSKDICKKTTVGSCKSLHES